MPLKKTTCLLFVFAALFGRAAAQTNQTVTNGAATTAVNFSGSPCVYSWTNSNPAIGLAASGSGNIGSFTAVNTGNTPVTATITANSVGYAYIASFEGNFVSVVNTATNAIVDSIPVGNNPYAVAISPDGTKAYVTNYADATVSVINTATNTVVANIGLGVATTNGIAGVQPQQIVVSPDGTRLYVTCLYPGHDQYISVINISTDTVIETVSFGSIADYGLAISPDGTTLYVPSRSPGNEVFAMNTSTFQTVATIYVGLDPQGLAVSPDGTLLYAVNQNGVDSPGSVTVVNTANYQAVATIPVGTSPIGIGLSPDGSRAYITNLDDGTVSVINTITNTVIATIPVRSSPLGISVAPDGSRVYVANNGNSSDEDGGISIISAATDSVLTTIADISNGNDVGHFISAGAGCGTVTFTITVNPSPPAVSYSSPQAYVINTAITPFTPTNSYVAAPGYNANPVNFTANLQNVLSGAFGVATDLSGNVYVVCKSTNQVVEIPVSGSAVGLGTGFSNPTGIAVDAAGNVYVADSGNNAVKEIPVGNGAPVTLGSGFSAPYGVAVDAAGNVYVGDTGNNAVKEIPANGGSPVTLGSGFITPYGVAVDGTGNVYVADYGNNAIKEIPVSGGSPVVLGSGFVTPYGVAVDGAANVYVADYGNNAIKEIPAGGGAPITLNSTYSQQQGIAIDAAGNLYFPSGGNIFELKPVGGYYISPALPAGLSFNSTTGVISGTPTVLRAQSNYTITAYNSWTGSTANLSIVVANGQLPSINYASPQTYYVGSPISPLMPSGSGVGTAGYGNAVQYEYGFTFPGALAANSAGDLYVSDEGNKMVKKIAASNGAITTVISGFTPFGIALDPTGNLYAVDSDNSSVVELPANGGSIITLATGLASPNGLAADGSGNVYVAVQNESNGIASVLKIPPGGGVQTTIFSGLNAVAGLAVDAAGNVFIGNYNSQQIQEVPANGGSVITVASTGVPDVAVDIALDPSDNIYISGGNSIQEIPVGGGPPMTLTTSINAVYGIAIGGNGILYATSSNYATRNNNLYKITPTGGYYINQPLPAGLSFNTATGVISGTPTAISPATNYTITAYDSIGGISAPVNIAVTANASLSALALSSGTLNPAFAPGTNSYTASVGNAVSAVTITPTAGDPNATIMVNGSAVASGSASQSIPLVLGPNTITTVVTASDNVTTNTYTVIVTRAQSSVATLSSLQISSGTLSPAFSAATTSYTESLNYAISTVTITPTVTDNTASVTVNGTAVPSGSASASIALAIGTNTITTVVTAQDGTTDTYTIMVTREPSTNAGLANLVLNKGTLTPAFATATTSYTDLVTNGTTSIAVTPDLANGLASVTVNGTAVASGKASSPIALSIGTNTVTVLVTAQDGITTKTYTVNVIRPSTNAKLASLSISAGTLAPVFNTNTTTYTTSEINTTASVTVTPTIAAAGATIAINGIAATSGMPSAAIPLSVGSNNISIVVTAQDGVTTDTYTITATRAPSTNANLAGLTASKGTLSPAFATATTTYTDMVTNGTASITLTPTAADATATVTVNGSAVASGAASPATALSVGSNLITTIVTAQDGATQKTYTVNVIRPSTNAKLSALTISTGTLSPAFNTNTTSYTASVITPTVTLTPTAAVTGATIKVNGIVVTSGSASAVIALNVGSNTITTVVTAQDGITTDTYTLTVTRTLSTNASLSNITLSKGTLSPVFATATTTYNDMVTNGTSSVTLTPTLADANATVTVNGAAVKSGSPSGAIALSVGNNVITTIVTAQNGTAKQTYIVNVIRPSTNAKLSALTVSPGTLTPVFNTNTTSYTVPVANTVYTIALTPTAAVAGATIKINGTTVTSGTAYASNSLVVGQNTFTVVVIAQDGITTDTYTVTVNRPASSNAGLANITLSKGTLSPAFATATTSYTGMVTNSTASVTLTPTLADTTATLTVNGAAVISGKATGAIALSVGSNAVSVVVTAQDGVTTKTYTVNVIRPSTNAKLSALAISSGTLTPAFNTNTTSYTASLTNATASITVTPTVAVIGATIKVNGIAVVSGGASGAIALSVGSNTITTIVTAQDGVTTDTYTLTVTRAMAGANDVYEPVSVGIQNFEPLLADDGVNVHQGISPNGDGINDYLQIDNISQYPDNNLKIITRNGLLVFETKGYDNATKVFDGHSNKNGQMQLPGTYFYELDYVVKGLTKHKTGYLVLKY